VEEYDYRNCSSLFGYAADVHRRSGGVCQLCDAGATALDFDLWRQLTVEHLIGESQGGYAKQVGTALARRFPGLAADTIAQLATEIDAANTVTACSFCNSTTSRDRAPVAMSDLIETAPDGSRDEFLKHVTAALDEILVVKRRTVRWKLAPVRRAFDTLSAPALEESRLLAMPAQVSIASADVGEVVDRITSDTASTVLAEVLPGVAIVFGEVPADLKPGLIDFGLVSAADREQISIVLASIGNAATVAGSLRNAFASVQGLYRISDASRSLLAAGGRLAVKDGANLGAVLLRGGGLAQARFIPVTGVGAAEGLAAIGPALAMVALQMMLNEVAGLVRTNIALASQMLATIRHEQWAELTGLVETIDDAVRKAVEVGSVPASLWDTVAGKKADLDKQIDLYRRNVRDHVGQIGRLDAHGRRGYLEANAQAIVFDANALLSSLKAWAGHQALHAARARAAGPDDAAEARLADSIARDTRTELDSALAETASLVDSLTRELRIIAELLPGRATVPLTPSRRDSKAASLTSAHLLKAIEPLADALRPPAPPLVTPDVVCAPKGLDHEPYLRILRWILKDGETLRCLGFPYQLDEGEVVKAVGQRVLGGLDGEKWATRVGLDPEKWATLVAVTDRRIITARPSALRQQGETSQDIPVDLVRYVRPTIAQDESVRAEIDLITRDKNIHWTFHAGTDNTQVNALAAVLAESMTIPGAEREELQRRRFTPIEAGRKSESTGTRSTEPTGFGAKTDDAE